MPETRSADQSCVMQFKHVLLAAKEKITDHGLYLVENTRPHNFGPSDYHAFTTDASYIHWLKYGGAIRVRMLVHRTWRSRASRQTVLCNSQPNTESCPVYASSAQSTVDVAKCCPDHQGEGNRPWTIPGAESMTKHFRPFRLPSSDVSD